MFVFIVMLLHEQRPYTYIRITLAVIIVLIGSLVVYAWHTENSLLLQISIEHAPIQYHVAVGLILLGTALLFIYHRYIVLSVALFLFVLTGLTLLQYLFNLNIIPEQMLISHAPFIEILVPGRMSITTMLYFIISTIILFGLTVTWFRHEMLFILSLLLLILSAYTISTFLFTFPTSAGFNDVGDPAIQTAITFMLVGIAFAVHTLSDIRRLYKNKYFRLSLYIFFIATLALLFFFEFLIQSEHKELKLTTHQGKTILAQNIKEIIQRQLIVLYAQKSPTRTDSYESIAAIDNKGRINIQFKDNLPQAEQQRLKQLTHTFYKKVKNTKSIQFGSPITHINNTTWVCVYAPLTTPNQSSDSVIGILNLNHLFKTELSKSNWEYWSATIIYDGKEVFQAHQNLNLLLKKRWGQHVTIDTDGITLTLYIWPTKTFMTAFYSWSSLMIALAGLTIIFFVTLSINLWGSLKQANKAKSIFLSNISHELRTPLNTIIGYSELLSHNEVSLKKQQDQAKAIHNASKHLLTLVNDLLDLSKIEAKKITLSIESVSLKDTLSECIKLIDPLLKKHHIDLKLNLEAYQTISVSADYIRLKEIFLNLLSNAIKYNNKRGKINILLDNSKSAYVYIGIQDNGPGISKEKLKLIFKPFQRLGTENSHIEGTGIGLTITKKLVEMQAGAISIESIPGTGTTVWLKLKRATKPPSRHKPNQYTTDTKALPLSLTGNILLIEDNLANQAIMLEQLNFLGLQADIASNAKEAYTLWEKNAYDLIFMDYHLPITSGLEITAWIRHRERGTKKHIPIIAFTASANKKALQECFYAGMDDYITKPIELAVLKKKLAKWIPAVSKTNKPTVNALINAKVVNLEALEKYLGKDPTVQNKLLNKFSTTCASTEKKITQAYKTHAYVEIQSSAHQLKSSAKAVGALLLSSACAKLESAAKTKDKLLIDIAYQSVIEQLKPFV